MNMGLARRKTFPGGLSSHCFCCIPREGDEALTCSGPHRKCFCLRRHSLPSPLLCFLHFQATCLPKGPSACHPRISTGPVLAQGRDAGSHPPGPHSPWYTLSPPVPPSHCIHSVKPGGPESLPILCYVLATSAHPIYLRHLF